MNLSTETKLYSVPIITKKSHQTLFFFPNYSPPQTATHSNTNVHLNSLFVLEGGSVDFPLLELLVVVVLDELAPSLDFEFLFPPDLMPSIALCSNLLPPLSLR